MREPLLMLAAGLFAALIGGPAAATGIQIEVAGEANGTIIIDLLEDIAPQHVRRITTLAAEGAYDGVVFHRVIEGFMAQTGDVEFGLAGGDMRRAGMGRSNLPNVPAEFSDVPFDRGVVGMARSQNPNSANSQFFIMFSEGYFLNGQYTVIGRVTAGQEVVDAIKRGAGPNGAVIGAPDMMRSVTVID
ncbi:MAG: peptidylprolyl isomerase [Pseudomonadota bacterium]